MKEINYKKRILITGGAGYVGSTLIRDCLEEGFIVRCLDLLIYDGRPIVGFINHPNFEFIRGDIRDAEILRKALGGIDCVVHLAAIVGDVPCRAAPKSTVQINFQGTKLIADLAKEIGIERFIFGSTCSNYGVVNSNEMATETTRLNPVSLYAETKIDCERYLTKIHDEKFATICLRFGTAYGISFRTRFDLLVNSFAYEALTKKEIIAFAVNTWRPYIHVADMSLIIRKMLCIPAEKISGQIFNAGSTSQNFTKRDVIEVLKRIMPGIKTKYIEAVDDRRDYRVDFSKLENIIGFKPTKNIEDGFRELIYCFKYGVITENNYEANKLETLEKFFKEKEEVLGN